MMMDGVLCQLSNPSLNFSHIADKKFYD